jgi:hypothetical protein
LRVLGNFVRQEFQGDKAMQPRVFGFVDHAHAATTEFVDNAVVRDSLADHSWQILRLRNGQVNERRGVRSATFKRLLAKKSRFTNFR